MHWLISLLIVVVSALLWRIRGGLRFWGHKAPLNKIWYAVFIGVLCFLKNKGIEISVNATISTYVAYQLNSWGLYIGRLCLGGEIGDERENPLIDEIIFPLHITIKGKTYYLCQFPHLFGFVGTTMTGAMVTYLMGLGMADFWFGFTGLGMGLCYLLGHLVSKYIYDDGKGGWKWSEWIFGTYMGAVLAWVL